MTGRDLNRTAATCPTAAPRTPPRAESPPGADAPPGPGDPPGRPDDPGPAPFADPVDGLVLEHPAELAGAVPVLLGFHPRDSLVLVSIGGAAVPDRVARVGLTVRVDLPPRSAGPRELAVLRDVVVDSLLRDRPRRAALLVFAAADGPGPPHRRLVDAVTDELAEHGVRVLSAVWAESTAEGARWACYDPCGCRGTLPDPSTTPIAAANVVDGRVVHGSRADLSRSLEPADPARVARREELLATSAPAGRAREGVETDPGELAAAARVLDRAIIEAGAGRLVLDDALVVALARALAVPTVRDEAMRRCTGRRAGAAEDLWLALVRETPDPEAVEPAALLAISALQRGDGGLANVALDRAEQAWPGHRLTRALRQVAAAGLSPVQVRDLLRSSLAGRAPAVRPAGPAGSARTARRRRPSS
jgi:hypothetical protein